MKKLIKHEKNLINTTKHQEKGTYISLYDLCMSMHVEVHIVRSWLRLRNTLEFLGNWEKSHNSNFKNDVFLQILKNSKKINFNISIKSWLTETEAIGIMKTKIEGRTQVYAHPDIALEFAAFLSPNFRIYLFKEFQRLKNEEEEAKNYDLQWSVRRELSKINYRRHAEAVKKLIPPKLDKLGQKSTLASEADLLNIALFGINAKEWRVANTNKSGNIRDHASMEQLTVLANLENLNAYLIEHGFEQDERLQMLNKEAIKQMELLLSYDSVKGLQKLEDDNNPLLLE